jgi:tetratricopeptide (TPR) repeat protein
MKRFIGAVIALGVSVSAAKASTALEFYEQGKYEQSIAAGLRENDAAGFAVAARAELAGEMMREEPCLECLRRAEGYARRAIAADPKLAEGHVYLAVTLGYEARIIGIIEARIRRYAEQAKIEIDTAIADDPRNAWAWAALGGWNVEIVHSGGKTLARWLYGASLQEGLTDFQKSFAFDPTNLVLRCQYAITLASYDRARFHTEIATSLEGALAIHPQTAYEAFAQSRAHALLSALNGADTTTFESLVRHDQGYP